MTAALRIATVGFGAAGGLIGITQAPGRRPGGSPPHRAGAAGDPVRDLAADLDAVAAWGATAVVTLVEAAELELLGIAAIPAAVRRLGMAWHHWPIADYQVPDAEFMAAWPGRSAMLRDRLDRGARVLVHCRGGLGRSGSVAARLLVEGGMDPAAAIAAVRAVRPGAVETAAQAAWVASVL